ncbi:MAG TPA: ABC transporter permease [Puia sp.]|nr:ABC transporter permease [Puia sp.]
MLKSYIRVALRNLRNNKIYSVINIAGLAVGLAVFWLMGLYIADELSYDRASPNSGRIYRVVESGTWSGGSFKLAITSPPFAPALKRDYPEIEAAARIDADGGATLINGDKKISAGDMVFADNDILTVFRFAFLYGDPNTALTKPGSIVLTRTLAEKLFGNAEDALGKPVGIEHGQPSLVTGIIEDQPENAHLRPSALRAMPPIASDNNNWLGAYLYTYILLRKDADVHRLEARLPEFYDRYLKTPLGKGATFHMDLQPLTWIHLHSHLDYELSRNGDIRYIWLFAAIALLVLGIAVINYINLATARSSARLKEIGVRKVIGSGRQQLMALFLTESVVFALLAAAIATLLASLFLPAFNALAGKALTISRYGWGPTLTALALFAIAIGLAGGLYPALFLSGFKTIPSLKGLQGNPQNTILFRKSLVTFQFVITIFLIAGSAVIYLQLHYMQNKDLGFNKDQVLTFHIGNRDVRQHIEELKAQLKEDPSVEAAAAASNPIGQNYIGTMPVYFEQDGAFSHQSKLAQSFYVDADYLPTMQINLKEGRNFSAAQPTDVAGSVLINETLEKEMGWTSAVGRRLRLKIGPGDTLGTARIVGVVRDFNIYSLQYKIQPIVLEMPPVLMEEDNVAVRVNPARVSQALKHIADVYHRFDPGGAFQYNFLDENFSRQYDAERRQGSLLLIFTVLAIFIACLGLLGLVTFSVGQRTKEIGIRKVLGAGVAGIVLLISKDLIKPVVIAILIATPLAWYATHRWLEGFAYRTPTGAWIFLGAGAIAVSIAMLTVGLRAMQAAQANPAKSLKAE